MNANASPALIEAMPISLRQDGQKWEIFCAGRAPLVLPAGAPPATLTTVRRALDQRKILHFQLVAGTEHLVAGVQEKLPEELPEETVRRAPALPIGVTANTVGAAIPKDPDQYTEDRVLWVTPIPTNRVIRLTFEKLAAPYFLAEVHPRKAAILALAATSIQEGRLIRVAISGQFVLDLLPAKAP